MKQDVAEKICKKLDISIITLRQGLKDGKFPFGTVVGRTFILYPEKVKEYVGIDIENQNRKGSDRSQSLIR